MRLRLKDVIDSPIGLRFLFEELDIQSGYARRTLLEKEMMESVSEIESVQNEVISYHSIFSKDDNKIHLKRLQYKLQCIKDIRLTLENLVSQKNLDDIEFFEVKHLLLLAVGVDELLKELTLSIGLDSIRINEALSLLDPDGIMAPSFYIYDSYSEELAALRERIGRCKDIGEREMLISQASELEQTIRRELSNRLSPYYKTISETSKALVNLDIAVAKSILIDKWSLVFPTLKDGKCEIIDMFNPLVANVLQNRGKVFQRVSISYGDNPILIIGANMGGKTVVLKTIALCQYLTQFGFPIPASKGEISIKKRVFLIVGDSQDESKGLSSFASEISSIDDIIRSKESGREILALIDEPARSTNPIEGTALVESLISVLNDKGVTLVLTTHYNLSAPECKRLKVKGLINGEMDYSLHECSSFEVPHEALNVAESMNISKVWIDEAKRLLIN